MVPIQHPPRRPVLCLTSLPFFSVSDGPPQLLQSFEARAGQRKKLSGQIMTCMCCVMERAFVTAAALGRRGREREDSLFFPLSVCTLSTVNLTDRESKQHPSLSLCPSLSLSLPLSPSPSLCPSLCGAHNRKEQTLLCFHWSWGLFTFSGFVFLCRTREKLI